MMHERGSSSFRSAEARENVVTVEIIITKTPFSHRERFLDFSMQMTIDWLWTHA